MKKVMITMLAGAALIFSSCTKTGPQGPAGVDGNANVIGSNKKVTVSSWDFGSNVYSATISDGDITSDIVNTGVVEVYKQYPDGSWTNLPDINEDVSTVYNFYNGGFIISVLTTDGTNTPAPGTITFRDVIISASERQAHPNTNWKNYNEAMAALSSAGTTAAPAVTQ